MRFKNSPPDVVRVTADVTVESLESRRLFAWGAAAQLMDQDEAATLFPNITGQGVTVAVIDTGIDYTHPSLGGGFGPGFKVKAGYDFVDNDADPKDTGGHGTSVAGLIAAEPFSFNGADYRGIAPDASLVALRVSEAGETVTYQTVEKALQWIEANRVAQNITVVNFSFGAGRYAVDETNPTVSDEFQRLHDAGVFFVSAAGNDGTTGGLGINYPAADPNVIAVGSVSLSDQISSFTQRGPTLDLLAPGESLVTTVPGGGYTTLGLTSFSSPLVAGAAALVKQVDPLLANDDILSILRASGVRKDDSAGGQVNRYSRIDLDAAVTLAHRRGFNPGSDVGVAGTANDMAYDEHGVLHFAHYDPRIANIKYATRSTDGRWSQTQIIDLTGIDAGGALSLAVDQLGRPSIAYYDGTEGDMEYARFDGSKWRKSTIDSKNVTGLFPSLAFDDDNNPVVAYYRKTSGDLRVMRHDGTNWVRSEVQTDGNAGQFASLTFSQNGTLGVAYADNSTGDLKYAQWNGSTWNIDVVDDLAGVGFISLAFDGANKPAISYYEAAAADLKYATKASGSWQKGTIGGRGAVGLYTSLWFDNAGDANIVYYSRKADAVFRVQGDLSGWVGDTLALPGGVNGTAAERLDGSGATYSWFNVAKNRIWTRDVA